MLIYNGPSLLDGEPIIVVAVPDYSKKVGTMLLTWIILRDVDPREAAYDGRDESICGSCPLRAKEPDVNPLGLMQPTATTKRACYVRPHLEPWVVWTKYHDDEYPNVSGIMQTANLSRDVWSLWQKQVNPTRMPVRIGSYGDPAVVPVRVWENLVTTADRFTGYTHMWDSNEVDPELKKYCMASVDSLEERERAQDKGWRTFLVVADPDISSEGVHLPIYSDILCPASNLGGSKTTCDKCRLCMGTEVGCEKSIWIPAHGPGKEFV